MQSLEQCFDAVKDYCRSQLVETTYNIFIRDIAPRSLSGGTAVLVAPSEFQQNMINERYIALLSAGFQAVLGFEVSIEIVTPDQSPETKNPLPLSVMSEDSYTFDNFVVGQNNSYAHAMAKAVAEKPAHGYNPLFIYGNSGLGKTHLLLAIKNTIQAAHPDYSILYVDSEEFTNDLIRAIRTESTAQFHERYRSADVLLMDDVQFIGGKISTEEELFHTFDTLYKSGRQIVLTSDRPPKEIKSLEERLRSRFEWGIMADIQPPDYETRVAIITSKADEIGFTIPSDVADFIASNIHSNIRQLEGAVKKLSAQCTYDSVRTPSIKIAQSAIKDILSEDLPIPITVEKIISEVSRTFEISTEDIRSAKQDAQISHARQVAMYVIRDITGLTMAKIGEEFSSRNYATVVYGIKKIATAVRTDSMLRTTIEDIEKNCRAN